MTTLGILISVAALAYLAATDPKRRRAFSLAPVTGKRRARLAFTIGLLPGVLLALTLNWSGLTIWLGATVTLGWALVAVPPQTWSNLHKRVTFQN